MMIVGHYCTGSRLRGRFVKYHPLLCSLCRRVQDVVEMEEEEADKYNETLSKLWQEKQIVEEVTYEI